MTSPSLDFDLTDPKIIRDPFPVFHALRKENPVHWSRGLRSWVLTRYEDVRTALRDPVYSADRMTPFVRASERRQRLDAAELGRMLRLWVVFHDPPDHTRLRRLLNVSFTPKHMRRLRPRIERITDDLLDRLVPRGEMDLISDFAYPLPALVIMHMLGVPERDLEQVREWSEELGSFVGHTVEAGRDARAHRAILAMAEYFRKMAAERRRRPQDDIVSLLVAAHDEKGTITEDELACNALYLLFAGHETTTNLFGNGIYHLLRHPEQHRLLTEHPHLIPQAVEEFLRYDAASPATVRVAAGDIVVDGVTMREGDRIVPFISAANRDPAIFTDPDRLDVTRAPNPHLSFGIGVHFCLGAPLARLEGEVVFKALLQRLPGLTLLEEEPQWTAQLILRGVTALPLGFDTSHSPHRATA